MFKYKYLIGEISFIKAMVNRGYRCYITKLILNVKYS